MTRRRNRIETYDIDRMYFLLCGLHAYSRGCCIIVFLLFISCRSALSKFSPDRGAAEHRLNRSTM